MAANVYWQGTVVATFTDENGLFELPYLDHHEHLIVSSVGYQSDTLSVNRKDTITVVLDEQNTMKEIVIAPSQCKIKGLGLFNTELITKNELFRMACCNLGESFITNASVDVNYSDAATGAKQIKLLGLSGTYVQMLTENIPNLRGAAAPYSLGYIPGSWMQSISVSKGASSVKHGYESIAGQINVEYKKPQMTESVYANLYYDTMDKFEVNADANIHLGTNWSTGLLLHYEDVANKFLDRNHDRNGDGFMDMPRVRQYNVQNRWAYMTPKFAFQAGIKALKEERESGQMHAMNPYRITIDTDRYELFAKNAYVFDAETNTNVALILSGSLHKQESRFGYKTYDVNQKNFYGSLMFERNLSAQHHLSTGLSVNSDDYHERYNFTQAKIGRAHV